MPSRLVYLPLEPYRERYTEYQSVVGGTIETGLRHLGVDFSVMRPDNQVRTIRTGRVLDTGERADWAFRQTLWLVNMIRRNQIDPDMDVIFLEDFWHPGFEMIPYTMALVYGYDQAKWPRIYSYCYAQSVDPNDFTSGMRSWMRPMEVGWSSAQTGIFVADPVMRDMMVSGGMCPANKIHVTGLFYDSSAIRRLTNLKFENVYRSSHNDRIDVIYSSRWDAEKDPMLFMRLVRRVLEQRPRTRFAITTGAESLRSNNEALVAAAHALIAEYPDNVQLYTGVQKAAYFQLLMRSKVQFNCSKQDFVSYTLLDATLCGCTPLYPNHLTFPGALEHSAPNLYESGSVLSASEKLLSLLAHPMEDYSWVYKKYEQSLHRALLAMGFNIPVVPSLEELNSRRRN